MADAERLAAALRRARQLEDSYADRLRKMRQLMGQGAMVGPKGRDVEAKLADWASTLKHEFAAGVEELEKAHRSAKRSEGVAG